jgi:hypothetical protein
MAAAAPPYTHWKAFSAASKDFDAGNVWKYTTKDLTPENDKRWICVFCSCNKGGWNATKALYHMAAVGGQGVSGCTGAATGTMPKWFRDAVREYITKKKDASKKSKQVNILRDYCFSSILT